MGELARKYEKELREERAMNAGLLTKLTTDGKAWPRRNIGGVQAGLKGHITCSTVARSTILRADEELEEGRESMVRVMDMDPAVSFGSPLSTGHHL